MNSLSIHGSGDDDDDEVLVGLSLLYFTYRNQIFPSKLYERMGNYATLGPLHYANTR